MSLLKPAAADTLTGEVTLLRKAVQTLNARLREIIDKLLAPDALVARLRLRLLPLIEKEIDKINPDANQ